jgi:hypothetical protein
MPGKMVETTKEAIEHLLTWTEFSQIRGCCFLSMVCFLLIASYPHPLNGRVCRCTCGLGIKNFP